MTVVALLLAAIGLLLAAMAAGSALLAHRITERYPAHGSFVEVDGLRIHHVDVGPHDGRPPVVFVHGASATLDEPRSAVGRYLSGRRVIYVDRPGHGYSDRGPPGMSAPAAQARVLAGLLDRLGVDRAVLVGHSWGAAVVAAFAVLYPERTAGLVFVAPATHPWPGGIAWYYGLSRQPILGPLFAYTVAPLAGRALLRASAESVFAPNPMPPDYLEAARVALVLRPASFLANARDVAGLKVAVTAMAPRYPEIKAPTVIVTGDSDTVVWPSIHSEGLARDIAGSELVMLPGVGHMPHHVRPDVIVDAIDRVTDRAMAEAP